MNKQEIQEVLKKWKEDGCKLSFIDFLKANNLGDYLKTLDIEEYLIEEIRNKKEQEKAKEQTNEML